MTEEERSVRDADRRRREAMIAGDLDTLDPLLRDDLQWIHGSAKVDTKAQFLASVASGATVYRRIDTSEESYRPLGSDVMVSTCVTAMGVELHGAQRALQVRNTLVWAKTDGSWRLANYQSTAISVA